MSDKTLSTTSFITLSQLKHPDLYTYEHTNYTNQLTPVIITCPVHGHFAVTPEEHLKGAGCLDCFVDSFSNKKPAGKTYNKTPKRRDIQRGVVYVMRDLKGRCKIGVSKHTATRNTTHRLKNILKSISENCPDDRQLQGLQIVTKFRTKAGSLSDAYKAELAAHTFFKSRQCNLPKFDGSTEFFSVSLEEVRHFLLSIGLYEVEESRQSQNL